jgi:hypothetical protein
MTGDTKAKGVGAQVETLIRDESMTDLVEKLRDMALDADEGAAFDHQDAVLLTEAADELSRLRSQVEEMRGALEPFQARVKPWMHACFGDVIPYDRTERGDRLLEEVFELLQSGGYDPARVLELRDYTWGRPPGDPRQEGGGVMVTLAAYCLAHGIDMHEAGEAELARIWTKVEAIRAKQAAKPRGIALPIDPAAQALAHPLSEEQNP